MDSQKPTTILDYLQRLNTVLATQKGRIKGEVTSVNIRERVVYFTIKDSDDSAQLNCLIWTTQYRANGVELKIGDEIIVTGAPDVYAPIGRLSFKTTTIEYAGEGALKKAYDELKAKLTTEGLLATERKRQLPKFPKKIGVITSMAGTVIHDFSSNLDRRGYKVNTIDTRVEGKDAVHDLLSSISVMAGQDIEVLVIMRGGGSWETLQAFNTESVVRAVANFKVPVVTGIGHHKDVTLVEMVADVGRSTPTAVAEALNAPWDGLEAEVRLLHRRTISKYRELVAENRQRIYRETKRITDSYKANLSATRRHTERQSAKILLAFGSISNRVRKADTTLQRVIGTMKVHLINKREYLNTVPTTISRQFAAQVAATRKGLDESFLRSVRQQSGSMRETGRLLKHYEDIIAAHDPKRTMKLGYSLTYVGGKLLRSKADAGPGSSLVTQLADGEITSIVGKAE